MSKAPAGLIVGFLSRLKFPKLFAITAMLFAADLLIPDLVPFADELLLGLGTALLSSWKKGRADQANELPRNK